jgi:hypothetical protein
MKIALVTGGQPRFTPDFTDLLNQLHGFDSADIYMTLWSSEWATTESEARHKLEKILTPKYNVAKVNIVDFPKYEFPPHKNIIEDPSPQNTHWWYKRTMGWLLSLSMAYDSIDKEYDAIVRFRVDCSLDTNIDISKFDLVNNSIVFPNGPSIGIEGYECNDMFAIATQEGMKLYCDLGKNYLQLIPMADPAWETSYQENGNRGEHLLGTWLKYNNHPSPLYRGDFNVRLNTYGRSKYTDKHYHHPIAIDPTKI